MKRTRVKICGITQAEDAHAAIAAGADAIGLVFWQQSSRAVSINQAVEICAALPAFVSVVALTVNAKPTLVDKILADLPVSCLQFHGDEPVAFCEQFAVPYIKALRMRPELSLLHSFEQFHSANSILLDAYKKGVPGGTGESFDWQLIPNGIAARIILAGGLNSENIERAITAVHPYAVDVSGGVESVPGIKDHSKINSFISGVLRADSKA